MTAHDHVRAFARQIPIFHQVPVPNAPAGRRRCLANAAAWPFPQIKNRQVHGWREAIELDPSRSFSVPDDHRIGIVPGLRHRCRRDGALVAAWCSAVSILVSWESFGAGWVDGRGQTAAARMMSGTIDAPYGVLPDLSGSRFRPRCCVHLERHDVRCACSRWRSLFLLTVQGPDDLRCNIGCLRAASLISTSSML